MKTKIIYISGCEVFDMRDVRAAFDEVRAALGLSTDTILFGVPVDNDSALDLPSENVAAVADTPVVESVTGESEPVVAPEPVVETVVAVESEPEITIAPEMETVTESEIVAEIAPETHEDTETVIPITSILTAVSAPVEAAPESVVADEPVIVDEPVVAPESDAPIAADEIDEPVITDVAIDSELAAPTIDDSVTETVTIGDMITDDAPVPPMEKSLEQLLESMKPLREDMAGEDVVASDDFVTETDEVPTFDTDPDTDATLAQLASEFAENQDKIIDSKPRETSGKIGKLKNILPFKKAKRDDSGLMGDLFGWAGIAANDDDFAMPGFFTNAAGKK